MTDPGRALPPIEAVSDMPAWSARQKLTLACRILAAEGHSDSLAGQLTLRAEQGGFWTTPLGLGFDEVEASSCIRVDEDLHVLEGAARPNPAVRFHLWIYRARPELNCIVHSHAPASSALSMVGEELVVAHMDAAMLYEECAYLPDWPGVPVADEEGVLISEALGRHSALLLAHHGLLTTGRSLEEACYLAIHLERAADLQIRAQSIGNICPIDPVRAREARAFLMHRNFVEASFLFHARRVLRADPGCLG